MNHYTTLGVEPEASLAEIRRAFRLRAQKLDVGPDAPAQMQALLDAWWALKDPESRERYDQLFVDRQEEETSGADPLVRVVRPGERLVLEGHHAVPLRIEAGGSVVIYGMQKADVEVRGGRLELYGILAGALVSTPGSLVVLRGLCTGGGG